MPLNLSELCKFNSGIFFKKGSIFYILKNKFNVCAILTILIILLIMIICPFKKNTSTVIFIRLSLYIFIVAAAVIMIHDGIILNDCKESTISGGLDDDNIDGVDIYNGSVGYDGDKIAVKPITGGHSNQMPITVGGNGDIFEQFGV